MRKVHVNFAGNITQEPQLKYTQGGQPLLTLKIAANDRIKRGDDFETETSYYEVVVWRQLAEEIAEALESDERNGIGVGVVGYGFMKMNDWEDKEGNPRRTYEITADEVGLSFRTVKTFTRRVREKEAYSASIAEGQSKTPVGVAAAPSNDPFGNEEPF